MMMMMMIVIQRPPEVPFILSSSEALMNTLYLEGSGIAMEAGSH